MQATIFKSAETVGDAIRCVVSADFKMVARNRPLDFENVSLKFLTFTVVKGVKPSLELLSSSSIVLETTFEHCSGCLSIPEFSLGSNLGSDLGSQPWPGLIKGKYGVVAFGFRAAWAAETAAAAAAEECSRLACKEFCGDKNGLVEALRIRWA